MSSQENIKKALEILEKYDIGIAQTTRRNGSYYSPFEDKVYVGKKDRKGDDFEVTLDNLLHEDRHASQFSGLNDAEKYQTVNQSNFAERMGDVPLIETDAVSAERNPTLNSRYNKMNPKQKEIIHNSMGPEASANNKPEENKPVKANNSSEGDNIVKPITSSNLEKAQELLGRIDKGIVFNKKPKPVSAAKDPKKMIGDKNKVENGWKQTVAENQITFEKSSDEQQFYNLEDLADIDREELIKGDWQIHISHDKVFDTIYEDIAGCIASLEKACGNGRTPDEEIPEDIYNAQMGLGANKKVEKNSEKAMKLLNKFTEGEIVNTSSGPMKSVGYYASQGDDPMTGKKKPDRFKQAFVPPNSTYNRRKSVEETLSPPEDKDPDYDDRGLNPSGNSYEPEPMKPKPLKQTTLDT